MIFTQNIERVSQGIEIPVIPLKLTDTLKFGHLYKSRANLFLVKISLKGG